MFVMDTRKIREFMTREVEDFLRYNTWLTDCILIPLTDGVAVSDDASLIAGAAYLKKEFKSEVSEFSLDQAKVGFLASQLCCDFFCNNQDLIPEILWMPFLSDTAVNVTKCARVFDRAYFEKNPYFANITIPDKKMGNISLCQGAYEKDELLVWNPLRPRIIGHLNYPMPCIGWMKEAVKYPVLFDDGLAWMSITPNEIETMRQPIDEASGDVLTLGCGLGYYAYMVSEKENVLSVTIVENNPAVIEIFREYILPQFPHGDKIRIVQADAFEYLRGITDGQFTYCFADLWANSADIVPYLKVRRICDKFVQTKVSYWIQDGLDIHIQFSILYRLKAQYDGDGNLLEEVNALLKQEAAEDPSSMAAMQLEGDLLMDDILTEAKFKNVADILRYLAPKNLATMLPEAD